MAPVVKMKFEFAGVNPCAEETLPAFGSCNLSSINLAEFVKKPFTKHAYFEFEKFGKWLGKVIYLNEVLDENMNLHHYNNKERCQEI